jgi:hypothetical protein
LAAIPKSEIRIAGDKKEAARPIILRENPKTREASQSDRLVLRRAEATTEAPDAQEEIFENSSNRPILCRHVEFFRAMRDASWFESAA